VNEDPRHDDADAVETDVDTVVELDAVGTSPEDAVAEQLRDALGQLRSEADRIATLGTGEQQVEAAEQFAEDAGRFDEQVGAAARAADEDASA
jgi:hypothetical protein